MTTFNFSIPRQTQHLWQKISSHWSHYNRPDKQRFLGSIQISQKDTDQVLDIVGYNLSNLSTVTYNKLYERFDEPEQNWLRILTFALSEYAYYYSSVEEKFWYGFCQKLQLSCNQSLEKTLRRIVGEGFDLLGLVKAKGGYPYVSTLWLQSGIPQQNLNHFAQLVQEFSNEYGWWEIAHSSCEDISEELFDFCQEKHHQWATLIHFLKSSCPQKENEEVEPISGQLLQGIAIIAVELERQGTLPETLKDDNEREKLLRNYYLPNNFFLRDWNSLIQVLTPKQRRFGNSRKIISRHQKPLSLVLDVTESLNMQLVLPEQSLWKKGWERLSGTFCQIPAAHWEGTIPNNPGLMIPEQVVNIKSGAELWEWQLLDHRKNCLNEWKLEGVARNLPCLIFDAGTGEHLNLDSANPSIRGAKEIIFFTPKGICLGFGNGIEIVDTCVPSSIRGWQGKQLTLTTKESSIVFIAFSDEEITTFPTISWKLSSEEQPSLRGLKLKGKKSVYLEIPTFWYPPIEGQISLNVSIENITHQKTIITTTEIIQPSDKWQAIPLDKWIIESGKYEARFWNQFHRWSYKFETQSNYQMASKPEIKNLLISSSSQGQVENLPIHNTSADTFWAEEIKIKGLLPLEIISLSLYNRQETVSSQCQADSLGNLHINLASFYNLLSPHSNWYALDFQRIGGETQRLIEMEVASLVISCTWDNQAVQISGLLPNELYSLSCWNLLLPENPPVEIKISPVSSNEDTIAIPLKLQPGNLWQHPYLEGSQPYKSSLSINDLVEQGVLHPDMATLFIPSSRRLYEHQEKAIRAVVEQQQNIVVATGTGSGKTECFLTPMLDMLLKEGDNLSIAGVRVLILYPMNALVNDQVKRLRQLLCRQKTTTKTKFGFYTSRTEKDRGKAIESLREEFAAYDPEELRQLFTSAEIKSIKDEELIDKAIEKTSQVQLLSREEMWEAPPHILITNYSMLEHMLIRPKEREKIFEASVNTFKMLVVDEAHTYDGAKGSEVSMLLERFKASVGVEQKGKIRCIATSASLGDASVDDKVIAFAGEFFGETFSQVIRGQRLNAKDRLGKPYTLPVALTNEEIIQYLSIIELPQQGSPISSWFDPLSAIVPEQQLKLAESQADSDIHKFLWFALKGHPLIHRLINILCREPKPWKEIVRSTELWGVNLPIKLDGSVDDTDAEVALAHLLQIGTLARANPDDLPLLPVRLHLLFRSLEGLYACINPKCSGAAHDPIYPDREVRYGQLYLNEKKTCECCASPVLELGSCSQCGQGYVFTQRQDSGELESLPRSIQALKDNTKIYTLTSGNLDSVTEEEEMGEDEEEQESTTLKTFKFELQKHGWIGKLSDEAFTNKVTPENEFVLAWHRKKNDGDEGGCYLNRCAACGAGTGRTTLAINRFVTYTDGPLEAMLDSLFELLPETEKTDKNSSKRKILTFSDGRQDAAFFASDYQRTHTEMLYRQMLWQAFNQIKNAEGITSVNQLINQLKAEFLEFYIPHPDRKSDVNYKSYRPNDPEEEPKDRKNKIDAEDLAQKRAKEILVKEFALYFNRRLTLEAFALLTCHIELEKHLIESVAGKFEISNDEAQILLTVITDIIRRTGIVSIEGSSSYFQETGGDGRRPEMIDAQGKSKNYLFLEKSDDDTKKYKDSPSFMPWKQGKVRKPPNRLGWYFLQIFGEEELPNKEDFIWLFRQLQDFGLLVSAKKGFQLNWEYLYIIETRQDWYKCNCCQQIFHVPSLSKITLGKLSVQRCSAYKCGGTLESYTPEKIEQTSAEHYQQYLIKQRLPLPLRSQEHTAQLGVAELEKRENRFRQGRINMLSCSTTLEMGVDIGELQAVVLRNFPPHVSNYQQRAGRAGRRTDGVAITLMYGQRRPHDRFYFEQPKELIAGSNQIPKLDSANFQIQQRHIHAELLAAFLRENWNLSAEEIKIAEFLDLPLENPASSENFTPAAEAKICKLQQWLNSDEAAQLAVQWLTRLGSFESQAAIVLRGFKDGIEDFQQQQLQDWNSLAEDMLELRNRITDPSETKNLEKIARLIAGTKRELDKVGSRRLHNELAQASILPIYGFPIDVVRLLTGESNEYNSAQGKHRLERDRRLALGEYAPDQEIIVDDRMYKSVGILKPTELEQKFYWVCQNCNHFLDANTGDELVESCPVCGDEPSSPAAKKMKLYKVPKAFTTDWEKLPEVTPYIKPQRQPVSQIFLINDGDLSETLPPQLGLYTLTVSKGGNFFLANQGSYGKDKGFDRKGFAICTTCGRDLSDLLPKGEPKKSRGKKGANKNSATSQQSSQISHTHPRTGKPCSGRYTLMHLGHEFCSDLLKIVFDSKTEPTPLFGEDGEREDDGEIFTNTKNRNRGLEFWRSLTYALLAAAAQVIDVPRTELDGLFTPRSDKRANIIIYDNVPGGAGYSRRVAERFDEVLKTALKIVSSCNCATSCYDCLQTYSNQPFHNQFNRHLVADFLRPIVEQVSPDEELQKFAPNSNRISLSLIADILPAICRAAAPDTLIYLPKLTDEFGLNKGSNLPWLNLLTDAVYSMRPINKPLELIVNHLPDPNTLSDASLDQRNHLKVWRKRLQQLIDQGLVKLYQVCAENLHQDVPTLCFNSNQSNRIALSLQQFSNNEPSTWFQTRSPEGVKTVFSRLEKLRQEARLVQASELEDINTTVIFLNPSEKEWRGGFSMSELRNKLRLEAALSGSEVTKVVYRDRYLREEGASILVELLKWGGFDTQSHVEILTAEYKDAKNAFTIEKELKKIFVQLQPNENNLSIRVKRSVDFKQWSHLIPHGRVLEIYRQDGLHYQVIFDIGMTFLARERGKYRVKFTTYVVVEKTI